MRRIDLAGIVVRAWKVISYDCDSRWWCLCSRCGGVFSVYRKAIQEARNIPCKGCEITHNTTHGHAARGKQSGAYKSWSCMMQRGKLKPTAKEFHLYTGRGIRVCERWMRFENFLQDMGQRPEGMQLDRIDNNAGYEPGNCRWVTSRQNNQNRRDNRIVNWRGENLVLSEAARRLDIDDSTLAKRLNNLPSQNVDVTTLVFKCSRETAKQSD